MANTPLLNITQVAPGQNNKETVINDAMIAIEQSLNRATAVSMASGDVQLTATQFTRNQVFTLQGLTQQRRLTVPNATGGAANTAHRIFMVSNPGNHNALVRLQGTTTDVLIPAGQVAMISSNGTALTRVLTSTIVGSFLSDAPFDGKSYARKDGAWVAVANSESENAHRYWRLRMWAATGTYGPRVYTLDMREIPGGPNVAINGTALGDGSPGFAFDGVPGTVWTVDPGNRWTWIGYDFNTPVAIEEFKVDFWVTGGRPSQMTLDYSDDGINWTTAQTVNQAPPVSATYRFPWASSAAYVPVIDSSLSGKMLVVNPAGDGLVWIDQPEPGGTAEYPDFTGNSGKVLKVNATADGVVWATDLAQLAAGEVASGARVVVAHPENGALLGDEGGVALMPLALASVDTDAIFEVNSTSVTIPSAWNGALATASVLVTWLDSGSPGAFEGARNRVQIIRTRDGTDSVIFASEWESDIAPDFARESLPIVLVEGDEFRVELSSTAGFPAGISDSSSFAIVIASGAGVQLPDQADNVGKLLAAKSATETEWVDAPLGVPSITDVNGKILAVIDGALAWVSPPSSLPSMDGNNGKLLSVLDGAAVWIDSPSNVPPVAGNQHKVLAVNADATGIEWVTAPNSYPPTAGQAGKMLVVNGEEDNVEWVDAPKSIVPAVYTDASTLWRVFFEGTAGAPDVALAEIEFRLKPNGVVASIGGTPTASTSEVGDVEDLFDGDKTQHWTSSGVNGQWVAYEFTAPVSINEVQLTASDDINGAFSAPTKFKIQRFDETSSTWLDAWAVESAAWAEPGEAISFSFPDFQEAQGALGDLLDVDMTVPPSNNQVLTFDHASQSWKPRTPASGGGGGGIEEAPADGERYVRKDLSWVPAGDAAGGLAPFKGSLITPSTDQVLNGGTTGATLNFGTLIYDTGDFFSPDAPNQFTVPEGVSKVRVSGRIATGASPTANAFRIVMNGNSVFIGSTETMLSNGAVNYSNPSESMNSAVIDVVPGDVFTMIMYSSAAITLQPARTWFAIEAVESIATSARISDLVDANIPSEPAEGDSLIWNSVSKRWEPGVPVVSANAAMGLNKPFRGALVGFSGAKSLAASVVPIIWDVADYDTDALWSAASPGRFTIPAGVKKVRMTLSLVPNGAVLSGNGLIRLRKNGGDFRGGSGSGGPTGFTDTPLLFITPVIPVVEGDYFEARWATSATGTKSFHPLSYFAIEILEVEEVL